MNVSKFYKSYKNNKSILFYCFNYIYYIFSFLFYEIDIIEQVSIYESKGETNKLDNVKMLIRCNGIILNNLFIKYENIHSIGKFDHIGFFIDVINYKKQNEIFIIHLKVSDYFPIKEKIKKNMY